MLSASGPGPLRAQEPAGRDAVLRVPGLSQPVEIRRDRWGINHIYAATEQDLFFAQGYAAAKDRLFQFEMWRRQATGTVAEILGRRELERDRGARLHMFRGDLDAELAHYHPRGKAIVEAFVGGINAYIAETERTPSLLPLEFTMLGITPGRWTPAVVISRHQGLTSNLTGEVAAVRAMKAIGPEALRSLLYFQGGEPVFRLDPAIDLAAFPDNVLGLYSAFRDPIQFRPEDAGPRVPRGAGWRCAQSGHRPWRRRVLRRFPRHREQQLGHQRQPHPEHVSHPRQRSAPRPERAVAALLGAPGGARVERHRWRRTGAAGRVYRTQRARRVGPDDLRQ